MNKVWIELENPRDDAHAEEACKLVNRMLKRLRGGTSSPDEFFWDKRDRCYCFGGQGGYRTLSDRGEWFNLDFFGRERTAN